MKKRLKEFFQRLARWLNVREMRQHKVKAGVYIIIRLILVSLLTAGILNGKWENVMTCVLTLGLLMLPLFIDRKLSVALPTVIEKQNENRHTNMGERLNFTRSLLFKISVSPKPTPAQIKPFTVWSNESHIGIFS